MATTQTQFWGDDLKVTDALTPIAVMRQAAAQLPRITNDLLEADVETDEVFEGDGPVKSPLLEHTFTIVAPCLNRYAAPLLTVRHDSMLVYPAHTRSLVVVDGVPGHGVEDNTEDELRATIQMILRAGSVRAIIYSLLAKINEAKAAS